MQQDKYITRYIKRVKKIFPYGYSNKNYILSVLKDNLTLFFFDHPNATYDDLNTLFGSPESYVESFLSSYSSDELRKSLQLKKRKYIILGTFGVLISIAIIYGTLFFKHETTKHFPAYIEEQIIIETINYYR